LLGKEQEPHDHLYWENPQGAKLAKAVRMGTWKGYRAAAGKALELYDLASDRAETKNVAADHPDVVKKIEEIMRQAHTDTEIPTKPDPRIWKKYQEENRKLDALFQEPGVKP
jgi:arylsulfatase